MKDKISVIIPCYNSEMYIDRCLQSIENQTYGIENLEVILVNDLSRDNTCSHLINFEKRYPDNVIVVNCESHCGPGTARNIGVEYATGIFVTFVDSDDVINATMLEKMQYAMRHCDCQVVECGFKSFKTSGEISCDKQGNSYFLQLDTADKRKLLIFDFFRSAAWGRLYRKDFLDSNKITFSENMEYGEDNFFTGLVMLVCQSFYYIGETLYYYFDNENGIMNRKNDNYRIRQLVDIMELFLGALYDRKILNEVMNKWGQEFEYYMVSKYFITPVLFAAGREIPGWKEEIQYFRSKFLSFFPNICNNFYLNSDDGWSACLNLLKGSIS